MKKTGQRPTRLDKTPRRTGRVFLLGAGASAACQIPVARDILRDAVSSLRHEDEAANHRIHELLAYLYPNFSKATRGYPNIEDFLNLVEMALTFNSEEFIASSTWPRAKLEKAKRDILKAVTNLIWNCMTREDAIEPMRRFVRSCVRPGDTIITFNWDLTVEHALESRDGADFWYGPRDDVLLLKPHGSVDWFPRANLPGKDYSGKIKTLDQQLCVYPRFDFAAYSDLRATAPVIVPPLASKEFPWDFLKQTWCRVYREIASATTLFIMGYSLPREDQFARLVIGRALLNNRLRVEKRQKKRLAVTLVNPDEAVQPRFLQLIGGKTIFHANQARFEDFVAAVEQGDIDLE